MKKSRVDKIELFENYPIPKAVANLAIPTIMACLVMVLYNLADTFFVGWLNDPIETSAVTLGAPVILAFNAVTNLFGTGCSSLMSRSLGLKDYNTFKKTSSFGFYGALICGFLFSVYSVLFMPSLLKLLGADILNAERTSSYLFWTVSCGAIPAMLNVVLSNLVRSEGDSLNASIGVMSGCILNIILDPIFIMPWGLNMKASGAGLATFLSNTFASLYLIICILKKKEKTYISMNIKDFLPNKYICRNVFGVGIPASIQNILNVTGMTILNNFMASYGTEAVSAMGITHKMSLLPLYISMGMSQGVLPLIGYNYSAKNTKRVKEAIRFTEFVTLIIVIVTFILSYTFAQNIIKMFMTNTEIVNLGTKFLRAASIGIPFMAFDFLVVGIFQAFGMGAKSLIFAITRKVILEIPAMFILNKIYPMYGLAFAMPVAEFVLCFIALIILKKILNNE